MNTPSHTPWHTKQDDLGLYVVDRKGYTVAMVFQRPDAACNVKLFAASPELLHALDCIVWWHSEDKGEIPTEFWEQAKEAIKNARVVTERPKVEAGLDRVSGASPDTQPAEGSNPSDAHQLSIAYQTGFACAPLAMQNNEPPRDAIAHRRGLLEVAKYAIENLEWNLSCPRCGVSPEGPCGWPKDCPVGLSHVMKNGSTIEFRGGDGEKYASAARDELATRLASSHEGNDTKQ